MTPPLLDAIYARGLFRLWVPRSCGGEEVDLPESLRIFEAASQLDGSLGWAVTIGTGGGLFAAFLEPAAAKRLYRSRDACIAGSGSPSGTAHEIEGGYRAGGRWRFASGAPHATTFTANCVVHRNARPVLDASGSPLIRAMAFPPSAVRIIPTWDTVGMRATASHDFAVDETVVPASHTFSVFTDAPRETGPLYRFPFSSTAETSFAAVALGVARHALDAFAELAAGKRVLGHEGDLAAQPVTRIAFAAAEAGVRSARAWFYEEAQAAWATVCDGAALTDRETALVRLASCHPVEASLRAVDSLHHLAGMSPLFRDSAFGRCWRDLHTVSQHALLSPAGLESAGAELLRSGRGARV